MKKILILLILLSSCGFSHAAGANCEVSQDVTAYYDSANYHRMYYLQSTDLAAWSARMATDRLEWRARLIPAGTKVQVVESGGDSTVIKVGGNTYYVMPDSVDCSD